MLSVCLRGQTINTVKICRLRAALFLPSTIIAVWILPSCLSNPVRSDLTALIAKEYRDNLFFRLIILAADVIWLDRSKADFTAFRQAVDVVKQGGVIGIAPEGTRSRVGQLLEGKPGIHAAYFAGGCPDCTGRHHRERGYDEENPGFSETEDHRAVWQSFHPAAHSTGESRRGHATKHHRGDVPDRRAVAGEISGVL